jgi:hypothetical protein
MKGDVEKLTTNIEKAGVFTESRQKWAEPLLQQTLDLWHSTAELVVAKTDNESPVERESTPGLRSVEVADETQ